MNVGLLKHGCPVTASWRLKKMCKVSILSFHAGIAGDRLREPYFLPPHLTEAVYQDFLRDVLSCWEIRICGLGFIYVSCMMVFTHILCLHSGNS